MRRSASRSRRRYISTRSRPDIRRLLRPRITSTAVALGQAGNGPLFQVSIQRLSSSPGQLAVLLSRPALLLEHLHNLELLTENKLIVSDIGRIDVSCDWPGGGVTEAVVPGGTGLSNLSRARDYEPDRNSSDKERHRDGDYSRARETHHRQFRSYPSQAINKDRVRRHSSALRPTSGQSTAISATGKAAIPVRAIAEGRVLGGNGCRVS